MSTNINGSELHQKVRQEFVKEIKRHGCEIVLFRWLKCFRETREKENRSRRELLERESIQIAWAVVAVILIMGR
jgi:hypothetical protein